MSNNHYPAVKRCHWCGNDPLYIAYHDKEWGVPLYDDQKLFEMLMLEGMQAGLSWITVLRKRNAFKEAFANFDPKKIATFSDEKIAELLGNEKIIRHKLKIKAVIQNAKSYLALSQQTSFNHFLWQFVDGVPIQNHCQTSQEMPSNTPISDTMSKALKQKGFKFVGSTICYAFMQAVGMVNDHAIDCFRYHELTKE